MTGSFQFTRLPRIFFGPGKRDKIPGIVEEFGTNIILVTGNSSLMNGKYGQYLLNLLENRKIQIERVIVGTEPTPEIIDRAVSLRSRQNPKVVLAIGGGSAIDAGKAISAMLKHQGSISDYLEGVGSKEPDGSRVPFIAVPTTSGTGSEATKNAVISKTGVDGFKKSLRHDNFVPDTAIIDPELTVSCPPAITAASGMDCFTQLTEAYLSTNSGKYTDALAVEGIRAVQLSLLRAVKEGDNLEARTGMSFAALTSGICLANAGLGVIHGFASSIGAMYDIPHGLICGTLMAAGNEVNVKRLRKTGDPRGALLKYSVLGRLFRGDTGRTNDYYIDAFIDHLYRITSDLGLAGLKKAGIRGNDLEAICNSTGLKNNPVKLDCEDLMEILEKRYI